MTPEKITFIDSTLREGQQNPEMPEHEKYNLTLTERVEIFSALVKYGVRYVEVFSPSVNQAEAESLPALIQTRNLLTPVYGYTKILGHVRCDEGDCQSAIDAGVDGLNIYFGTSKESCEFNHGKNLFQIAHKSRSLIESIHQSYPHLELRFSGEDAFRTDIDDLFFVYDNLADLVCRFGVPDTVGIATPKAVFDRIKLLRERYPNLGLESHFHNDLNLAQANAISALDAGLNYIDTTILGLGDRSGINSITALVLYLHLYEKNILPEISLIDSYSLNVLVASIMRMQVPYTEPVSLTNATHSAGPHTSAMLKNSATYQALPLHELGVDKTRLLLGPLSGWHTVNYYLTHILNFNGVTDDLAKQITPIFKDRCSINQEEIHPTKILTQTALEFGLTQKQKPLTHIEEI